MVSVPRGMRFRKALVTICWENIFFPSTSCPRGSLILAPRRYAHALVILNLTLSPSMDLGILKLLPVPLSKHLWPARSPPKVLIRGAPVPVPVMLLPRRKESYENTGGDRFWS